LTDDDRPDFPIVGVGASAGGLEAYRQFLSALPVNTGAAFVLVQHLDPNHESMMAELLSEYTRMPVRQADQNTPVEPDHVYIIPPNKFITLVDHGIFLDEPVSERGVRMSVDHFFRSMAAVRGERAIGVLLSGTGSDGTLGIREIKAVGGVVMVQRPSTAEYDGMPRSAVATGVVDFVLPIDEMVQTLTALFTHPTLEDDGEGATLFEAEPEHFAAVLSVLQAHTQYDFHCYKRATLERRVRRRMGLRKIGELKDYVAYLRDTPDEATRLFKDLLIGVTRFFRDPDAWTALESTALVSAIRAKAPGDPFRVWIPGCASGEEAYTLAMVLFDQAQAQKKELDFQIFATDLNDDAISVGRNAIYPASIAADVPLSYLRKYFIQDGGSYRVNKRLRDAVVFATQNVISDPPFSNLNLICCRNLMIYLDPDVQSRLVELFHFALAKDGVLFLGPSESGERSGGLFEALSKPHRIYRRVAAVRTRHGSFPILPPRERLGNRQTGDQDEQSPGSGVELAKRLLLERFVPASVLVNRRFEVEYYHGPLRNYLDFPTGEPSSELTGMALEGLRGKLRAVLARVLDSNEKSDALSRNVRRDGHEVTVRVTAEPVAARGGGGPLILVTFEDASEPRDQEEVAAARAAARASSLDQSLVKQLEYELQATKEDLQSSIEELETSNEELKASNEEVMSMNEEMQSTNEELETSREELQSLNEELSTVNSQLEEKIREVEASNNDLANLLRSTNIATIFLDTNLCIRRFTPATQDLMRVLDSDVGRPIEDLAPRVNDRDLLIHARQVLDRLQPLEAEVQNDAGRSFMRRIQPYRTSDNKIEGVVVTFTDVTLLQEAARRTRKRETQQEAVAQLGRMALASHPLQTLFDQAVEDLANRLGVRLAKVLQLTPDGTNLLLLSGVGWSEGLVGKAFVGTGSASQAGFTLQRSEPVIVKDFASEKRFAPPQLLRDHKVTCGASVLIGPAEAPWGILGAHDTDLEACAFDVDDINFMQAIANLLWLAIAQRRAMAEVEDERREISQFMDSMPFQLAVVSPEERYLMVNESYSKWGRDPRDIQGRRVAEVLGPGSYEQAKPAIDAVLAGKAQRFELAVRMKDGSERTNLVTYAPRRDGKGNLDGFYSAAIDITQQKIVERALAERTQQYQTIGESIPYGVWICDAQGMLRYISQSFLDMVGMTAAEAYEFGWADKLAPGTAEPTLEAWKECLRTGCDWTWEHHFVNRDGGLTYVLSLGRPIRNPEGAITSWAGLNLDITERKKEEERAKVISAELDHRVKNILATIGSIARLSGRSSSSLEDYKRNFEARIQALSRAHQTLAESKWSGMPVRRLVENELQPYDEDVAKRVAISGPDVLLTPAAAQSMSLVLHELTTNAAKYGALKEAEGKLSVSWDIREDCAPTLTFSWTESGLMAVESPTRTGFGTTVITDVVRTQCDAQVEIEYTPAGLDYHLRLPAECFLRNS